MSILYGFIFELMNHIFILIFFSLPRMRFDYIFGGYQRIFEVFINIISVGRNAKHGEIFDLKINTDWVSALRQFICHRDENVLGVGFGSAKWLIFQPAQ